MKLINDWTPEDSKWMCVILLLFGILIVLKECSGRLFYIAHNTKCANDHLCYLCQATDNALQSSYEATPQPTVSGARPLA